MTFQPPSTTNQEAAQRFFADAPALYVPQPVPMAAAVASPVKGIPVDTSPWWIEHLTQAMAAREARLTRWRSYFEGSQDTWRLSNEAFRLTFGRAFWGLKANLAKLVVLSAQHRLKVTGFRIPLEAAVVPAAVPAAVPVLPSAPPDPAGDAAIDETDDEAWRIWQRNNLDKWSAIAHTMALSMGECSILVSPNPTDSKTPRITIEDPLQVIVERDPGDPQTRVAALKRYKDKDGTTVHILYLPDRIEWWRATPTTSPGGDTWGWTTSQAKGGTAFQLRGVHFELDESRSGKPAVDGVIPVIPLVNMPRLDGSGEAEHEAVIPLLDLYNKTLMDMAVTSEFAAFPQRYAVGISLDEEANAEDSSGNVTMPAGSPLQAAINRLWSTENPDAKFGDFAAADLKPYVDALASLRSDIGTITFTPYHYLLNMPSSVPPTGEALKTAETALVAKCNQKTVDFGESWEEVMRVAFLTAGDTERASAASETRWAPTESRQLTTLADALVKLGGIGVPERQLWEDWGYTPQQIARFEAMRAASPAPAAPVRVTVPATGAAEVSQVENDTAGASPGAGTTSANGTTAPNGLTASAEGATP